MNAVIAIANEQKAKKHHLKQVIVVKESLRR